MNSPHKGQWRGALIFSFICVWINGWVNNHEAGDLRRNRSHYDVIVMEDYSTINSNSKDDNDILPTASLDYQRETTSNPIMNLWIHKISIILYNEMSAECSHWMPVLHYLEDSSKMLLSSQIWKLLNFHFPTNYTSFNIWARQLVWNFKGYLWNSTQNTPPIHWKIQSIYNVENLTHWGRVTHIWVSKLIIIGSDNGLSPGQWRNIVNLGLGNKF